MKLDFKGMQTSFMTAGGLMIGTGIMGLMLDGVPFPRAYSIGSLIVGSVMVIAAYAAKRFFKVERPVNENSLK
jgi:hypothetical protein